MEHVWVKLLAIHSTLQIYLGHVSDHAYRQKFGKKASFPECARWLRHAPRRTRGRCWRQDPSLIALSPCSRDRRRLGLLAVEDAVRLVHMFVKSSRFDMSPKFAKEILHWSGKGQPFLRLRVNKAPLLDLPAEADFPPKQTRKTPSKSSSGGKSRKRQHGHECSILLVEPWWDSLWQKQLDGVSGRALSSSYSGLHTRPLCNRGGCWLLALIKGKGHLRCDTVSGGEALLRLFAEQLRQH